MIIRSLRAKSCLIRIDRELKNRKIIKIDYDKIVKFPFKGNIFACTLY